MSLDSVTTIQKLKIALHEFRDARDWKRFHDPKNLAEAISIEASELLELFLCSVRSIYARGLMGKRRTWC
jgi:hypothetical protein